MKHLLKIVLCCALLCQCLILTGFTGPDWPADTGIQAEGGIVIDADSGAVLFGQNIHKPYPPASITKLLTALIVLEHAEMDEKVTFSSDAVYNVEAGSGNKLNVTEGDILTVEDCLYSLLLHSCNQAANALAEHVAGSREAFVDMMNKRIAEIGCGESQFANPSGLNDKNQYVTAYDMAKIAQAAFSNKQLLKIDSTMSHTTGPLIHNPDGLKIYMENKLLKTTDSSSQFYYPAAKAGKTGYTSLAGNTLVTYAERDGRHLISVVLKGKPTQYYLDSKTLLEFGFDKFQNINISQNEKSQSFDIAVPVIQMQSTGLFIDPEGVITLPEKADFSDAELKLITGLPNKHPEDAAALLRYTYHDRVVGQAYLLKQDIIPVKEPSYEAAPLNLDTEPVRIAESDTKEVPEEQKSDMPYVFTAVILTVGLACVGYLVYRKGSGKRSETHRDIMKKF